MPDNPHPLHLVGGDRDASNADAALQRLRAEIEARNRQQTAIAELGQAALPGVEPFILLGQACALLESTLGVDHARALEVRDGRVSVVASIGSNATFLHCSQDNEENESIAMYAALADAPVVFDDIEQETRFKSSHLRNFHGVRGGAAVIIPTASGIFGVLIAYSSRQRTFAEHEIAFLKSAASLLGEAVERSYTEQALRKSESRLKQLIASTLDAVFSVDRNGIVIEWKSAGRGSFWIAGERRGRTRAAAGCEAAFRFGIRQHDASRREDRPPREWRGVPGRSDDRSRRTGRRSDVHRLPARYL